MSRSVGDDIRKMTAEIGWNKEQMATFKISVRSHQPSAGNLETLWAFYLITNAYPCQETEWGNWSDCDASPVGIGHEERLRMQVTGLPGGNRSCKVMDQHRGCVVNKGTLRYFQT